MPAEKPPTKCSENRRSNKPIMEKRRRARINSCLNDLKALILEALKKDPARHSKLEKADILEMTVKHLQNLQRQQMALATATDPNVSNKFRAGFNECATEVTRYLTRMDGLDPSSRQRLLSHLTNCLSGLGAVQTFAMQGNTAPPTSILPLNVHVTSPTTTSGMTMHGQIMTPRASPTNVNVDNGLPNRVVNGLHLVPTRLPNGDFALLLPATYSLTSNAPTSGVISNANLMTDTTTTNVSHNAMHPLTCGLTSPSDASSLSPTRIHTSVVATSPHVLDRSQALPLRTVVKMEPHGDERLRERYIESGLSPETREYDYDNFASQVRSEAICKETTHKSEPWRPW